MADQQAEQYPDCKSDVREDARTLEGRARLDASEHPVHVLYEGKRRDDIARRGRSREMLEGLMVEGQS